MKKIFLLFGIAAFGAATAQQKDMFDINKHIQDLLHKKNMPRIIIKPSEPNNYFIMGSPQSGFKLSTILPDGEKVYLLPLDNMPCVVPDLNQFTIMPNIAHPNENFLAQTGKQYIPGKIPNTATPFMIIPQTK